MPYDFYYITASLYTAYSTHKDQLKPHLHETPGSLQLEMVPCS